jgi:hypothetical protein
MDKKNFLKGNDYFMFGACVIVFSVFMMVASQSIKMKEAANVPQAVIVFIGIMGLCMIIDSFMKYRKGTDESLKVSMGDLFNGIALPGALLLAAAMLSKPLGLYISSYLLVIAIMVFQRYVEAGKYDFSPKRIVFLLVFAFGTSVCMYLIFNFAFGLPTPKGVFGF